MASKGKLRKFEEFSSFNNVFEPKINDFFDRDTSTKSKHFWAGNWNKKVFNNDNPIVIEIGCGKGEYTIGLALLNPHINYIGIDIKGNRMWKGAKKAHLENINNCAFLRTNAEFVDAFFENNEISEIWLTFSDPQPKNELKRLSSSFYLNIYNKILKPNSIINLKTDNTMLYLFTKKLITENNYNLIYDSYDVYGTDKKLFDEKTNAELSIKTFYEQMFQKKGFNIKYLKFNL